MQRAGREQEGHRLKWGGEMVGNISLRPHFLLAKKAGEALFPLDGIVAKETRKT